MSTGGFFVLLLVCILFCAVGVVLYKKVLRRLGRRHSLLMVVLRCAALVLLAIFLLKPEFGCRALAFKPSITVIVDKSASMGILDCPSGKSRLETVLSIWLKQLKNELSDKFEIQEFVTASKTKATVLKEGELKADEEASNIIIGINKVSKGASAVLIFTDGQDTSALSKTVELPKDLPPVFCVGVGSSQVQGVKDIAVAVESVPQTVYLKTSFSATLKVSESGYGRVFVPLTLYEDDKLVLTQQAELNEGENLLSIAYAPQETGLHRYKVSIPLKEGEFLKENNEAGFYLEVVESHIPVFYAEGVPRWEYKFIKQVICEDPNIEFVGCVRVGAGDFVLQGLKEKARIRGALPADESEMKKFKILILGDIERSLLDGSQLAMVDKFVSDGGTLIVVGGENILSAEYRGTPLEALLPVRLEGAPQKISASFLPSLTEDGKRHPIFENYQKYFEMREQNPATVDTLYVAGAPKAGSVLLAVSPTVSSGGKSAPLVSLQNYGSGKVILVASDTLWRWYFKYRTLGLQSPYVRFYGQMIRWAAEVDEESNAPLVLRLSRHFLKTGENLTVDVELRGDVVLESIECKLQAPDGTLKQKVSLASSGGSLFSGVTSIEEPGRYEIVAEGATRRGAEVVVKRAIIVGDPYAEYYNLGLNEKLLRQIAAQTRGGFFKITETDKLLTELLALSETASSSAAQPFWQSPLLFLLLVGFLGAEYILRKRKGLV